MSEDLDTLLDRAKRITSPDYFFIRDLAAALAALRKKLAAVEGERDDLALRAAVLDEALTNKVQMLESAEARATAAEAVLRALGFTDNILEEKIGWRGVYPKPSTDHHFRCEFCQQEHTNCNEIPHTDDCPVILARAALTKEPGK